MSVFTKDHITYYKAPLTVGKSLATMSGSWTSAASIHNMDPHHLFQLRIHTWKQQFQSSITDICLDWVAQNNDGVLKHYIVLKFKDNSFSPCLQDETFMKLIQQLLDDTPIIIQMYEVVNSYILEKT